MLTPTGDKLRGDISLFVEEFAQVVALIRPLNDAANLVNIH